MCLDVKSSQRLFEIYPTRIIPSILTISTYVLPGTALQQFREENESQGWHPAENQPGCYSL